MPAPAVQNPHPAAGAAGAWLRETDVRALSLVRACETGPPEAALWSPEDASWASRLADETVPADAPPAAWLAARAGHAVQRIVPRRASLARLYTRRAFAARGLGLAALGGFGLGLASDLLGAGQRLHLLATPLWAVVGWNLLVYLWLGVAALRGASAGWLRRLVERGLGVGRAARVGAAGTSETGHAAPDRAGAAGAGHRGGRRSPEQRFLALWGAATAPLMARRAVVLLHVAAMTLALGLLAGLYARALVFDYRVGWQSTLLSPPQVHGIVSALLAPASALAGIAVPGADEVAALRTDATGAPFAGASVPLPAAALPWLHLWAATLAWAVLVPRLVLALHAAARERLAAQRVAWPLDDAYARQLLQGRRHAVAARAPVLVLPHGLTPTPAATLALRALLAGPGSLALDLHVAAPTAYGDEEQAADRLAAVVAMAATAAAPANAAPGRAAAALPCAHLAWFDLAVTPEPQVQGRFIAGLRAAARGPFALLVDEAGYRQRMGASSPRLAERRRAWQVLAEEAGVGLACIDLLEATARPEPAAAAQRALEAAWAATASAVPSQPPLRRA
ncbi:MAG: DUF2868 domain-containing protein [Rubrivivax sp.]|nr:DUF2868 domain-containing protein [Rubrivivax sp.]